MTKSRFNGGARSPRNARQVDQSVKTNYEFAKELGGTAQYPKAGGYTASRAGKESRQQTSVNLRGEY